MLTIEIRRWLKGNKTFIKNCIKIHKAQQRGQYKDICTYLKKTNIPNQEINHERGTTRISNQGERTLALDQTIRKKQKDPKKRHKEQDIRQCILKWDSNIIRDNNRQAQSQKQEMNGPTKNEEKTRQENKAPMERDGLL
eukprot:9980696-Ditylum_brightwellii.AAC.1